MKKILIALVMGLSFIAFSPSAAEASKVRCVNAVFNHHWEWQHIATTRVVDDFENNRSIKYTTTKYQIRHSWLTRRICSDGSPAYYDVITTPWYTYRTTTVVRYE